MTVKLLVGVAALCGAMASLGAQFPAAPEFEVASIKQNTSGDARMNLGLPAGRFTATNVPVKTLILLAFDIRERLIFGGPAWIGSERYDINAKSDVPLTAATLKPYVQQLLADRFKLQTHMEKREVDAYALVLARSDGTLGPAVRRPDADYCAEAVARQRSGQPPVNDPRQAARCLISGGPGAITVRSMPLSSLAGHLSNETGRMVVDHTGLADAFDFDLKWTPVQLAADPNAAAPSLATALQEQLGLKLQSVRVPVDVMVIDRVEHPTRD